MITINGVVKKIIYRAEETGFSIFKFEIENDRPFMDVASVKGTFFQLEENDYLKIHGDYQDDPKYGRNFVADYYEACMPDRMDLLEKYLSQGIIKGIGPARAKAIIKCFGKEALHVMEKEPERLIEVPGIGKRTAQLIGKRTLERGEMQETLLKLSRMGIGFGTGQKIYKLYKENTMHVLQTNPYKLIEDIQGIGFSTADKIARENGVHPESPYRISSGIRYALETLCTFGSVYSPKEDLIKNAAEVLGIGRDKVLTQLDGMTEKHELVCMDETHIYTVRNYNAEQNVAEYLKNIRDAKQKRTLSEKIMKELGNSLDEVQMGAVRTAACSNFMVLTGGPGVGKTTTTNLIIQYFEKEGKDVVLAAPTGRAAKRMKEATGRDSMTIHRLLEVTIGGFARDMDNPLEGDVFIIDEVSMMDIFLAEALFSAIPNGAQVILVGDKNQLPSIGPGNVLGDIIASGAFPVVELKKIYRQAEGSHIIENAHHILNNEPLNLSNRSKDFFFKEVEDPEQLKELLLHYVVDSLPSYTGESDIQVLSPVRKRELGVNNLNLALQDRLNPLKGRSEVKGFREGDKVMQIVNDYSRIRVNTKRFGEESGVFNGDVGRVSKIDMENEYLYVVFEDGWRSCYEFDELDSLELAYAVTIHKSQGSEYPVVVIPVYDYIPMLTTMNLLYTGVTRAKKAILILGSKKKLYQMIRNLNSRKRYTALSRILHQ